MLLTVCLAVIVASCGDDQGDPPSRTDEGTSTETPRSDLGAAEGVVIIALPDGTAEALGQVLHAGGPAKFFLSGSSRDEASFDGVSLPGEAIAKGVSLAAIESETFDAAYQARFGRSPEDFAGVREAYDAVYVVALAAAAANSTDGAAIGDNMHYVANSPGEIVNPGGEAFSAAVQALTEGGDVNYIGVSGQVDFTADGDLAKGRVTVWRLLGERIVDLEIRDVDLAAEVGAEIPAGELSPAAGTPDGPLRIGAVLPLQTDGGEAVRDAMQMAVDEINDAGGLFGAAIELLIDSADDATQAAAAARNIEDQDVSAIVGPPGEGALAVAEAVHGLHIALTSSPLLPLAVGGQIFRGAMSESLEAPPLANVALEDEATVVCVIFEPGARNKALANAFRDVFELKGGGVRLVMELSDDEAAGGAISACLGTRGT
ncbi:MAG: ABC transporter substrate-binding protein [Chloroflexi bacterium]|nr:ABC transporter substrate-binding protein [Chloroflexota bacterium]